MKQYSYLIKPASSLCNLECKYCFYHDVSSYRAEPSNGIMSDSTMRILIEKACQVSDASEIIFAFQGGEPTIAGLTYFRNFLEFVDQKKGKDQIIRYSIQTNGTLLNDDWYELFKEHHFLVGVSLDGYKENHDYFRRGHQVQPTFKTVIETIAKLRQYNIEFNILTVLSNSLAKHPEKLYRFYKENNFRYIQLIPCLPKMNELEDAFSLKPKMFASFYKKFYSSWLNDFNEQEYMSVTLFDDLIPMFKGIAPSQCGMLGFCSVQNVVESDGSFYPCDFYVTDEYCNGNINIDSIQSIRSSTVKDVFIHEVKRTTNQCATCEFINLCHGNCKRLNVCYFDEDYCGYRDFLQFAYPSMSKIASRVY